MGRLVQIEVENFKSYRGQQTIGPFYNFTSVIGPNGSGKSNLMDAISFVLGVKSTQLRSAQLRELIYRSGRGAAEKQGGNGGGEEEPKRAYVCAEYETSDGGTLRFMRIVTSSGTSEYKINDKSVPFAKYSATLEEENILIKAKNFLVFQGDVEAVASQSPKDLTRLLEQISGSLELKAEYERLKALQEMATENSADSFVKKRGVTAEMKQFKEQKEEAERFDKLQKQRAQQLATYLVWKLYHLNKNIEVLEAEIDQERGASQHSEEQMRDLETQLKDAKRQQARTNKDLMRLEKHIHEKTKQMEDMKPVLLRLDEKIRHGNKKLRTADENISKARAEHERETVIIRDLQKDYEQLTKALAKYEENLRKRRAEEGRSLDEAQLAEYNQSPAPNLCVSAGTHQSATSKENCSRSKVATGGECKRSTES
ncbi:uncharacterized protein SPPG_06899 [Spizellomyces punctatus DAOM BR117]|uniref:RecF/RecN/SMC N-terminal domain-containing protein n=1 Tax=Spizellomyces punctatus (strain DAOM BR117) TaxID=645134 RepID=A0A0L0HB11_SPIPD|nr:uncharacterized protein SPPG_06899 [Spizellomyces punctatus DAOM BR117]KNC97908.1 hypothetical protein SPPG_06899 [Spizellomyces punctatus DAOM BR117]|eukprot:XP_016605948.1 hypothetical protein SPPG_06899 [Spizellomyces punctatus DAOM BR117]